MVGHASSKLQRHKRYDYCWSLAIFGRQNFSEVILNIYLASETLRSVHPTELYTVKQNQIGIFLPSMCYWRWLNKMSMSQSLDRRWDVTPSPLFSNCRLGEQCYWGNSLVYTCFQILFITESPKHYLDTDEISALPKQPGTEI